MLLIADLAGNVENGQLQLEVFRVQRTAPPRVIRQPEAAGNPCDQPESRSRQRREATRADRRFTLGVCSRLVALIRLAGSGQADANVPAAYRAASAT